MKEECCLREGGAMEISHFNSPATVVSRSSCTNGSEMCINSTTLLYGLIKVN